MFSKGCRKNMKSSQSRGTRRHAKDAKRVIESTRIWKRCGFVLMISCGILLAGSKLDTYYANPYFLMKLSLLVLIGIHGLIFRPTVYCRPADLDRTPQPPLRAKLAGGISLVLWLSVLTCGRWIAYYDAPK